jgi:hypothetical protein
MKREFQVWVCAGNPKQGHQLVLADAMWMKDRRGIVLVWEWGLPEGSDEEIPVNYTKIENPDLNKTGENIYVLHGPPVWVEDVGIFGEES